MATQQYDNDGKVQRLESRYGAALTELQKEQPFLHSIKRIRLLRIFERCHGEIEQVRCRLCKYEAQEHNRQADLQASRREQHERLRVNYAAQLAHLSLAGISTNSPIVLDQLQKQHGNADKVLEIMQRRKEKKNAVKQLDERYASQLALLEDEGVPMKNRRTALQLLHDADGEVDTVRQLLIDASKQATSTADVDRSIEVSEEEDASNCDDIESLRELRAAGARGNPSKILAVFRQCNRSIELTVARLEQQQTQQDRQRDERAEKRILLAQTHHAYLTLNNRSDWPDQIEHVYLDGNRLILAIDALRKLYLNHARDKAERALGNIVAAWNKQMGIPNVSLIFDSTPHVARLDDVHICSAQPTYATTNDMLVAHACHRHTLIVTPDQTLAITLQREGCVLVKPYSWFAHCVMVLTPDSIKAIDPLTTKVRYDFDALVQRIGQQ